MAVELVIILRFGAALKSLPAVEASVATLSVSQLALSIDDKISDHVMLCTRKFENVG